MKIASKSIKTFFIFIEICLSCLFFLFMIKSQYYRAAGCILWGTIFAYLWLIQPLSKFHKMEPLSEVMTSSWLLFVLFWLSPVPFPWV